MNNHILHVPYINTEKLKDDNIEKLLDNTPIHHIDKRNWSTTFPSNKVEASFKIAHNGKNIYLHYFVEEEEILAKIEEDNGAVWTDSCVEFFISFDSLSSYYNAEFSCIGKALLGYRKTGEKSIHADKDTLGSIQRYPSLGTATFDSKKGTHKWNLFLIIPLSAFWRDNIQSLRGVKAKANLYKCGDSISEPHYLSWNTIKTEKPSFHIPQFFGDIFFE